MKYWTIFILFLFTRISAAAIIHYDSTFMTTIPPSEGEDPVYYEGSGHLIVDSSSSQLLSVYLECEPFTYSWTGAANLVEEPYWPTEEGRVTALHVTAPAPSLAVSFWFDIFFVPDGEPAAAHLHQVVEEDSFYGEYWFRSTYTKVSVSVPEPGTLALLSVALAGGALAQRKRSGKQS